MLCILCFNNKFTVLNKELFKYIFLIPRNKQAEKHLSATHFHTYSSYLFKSPPYRPHFCLVILSTADLNYNVSSIPHPWALIPAVHLSQIQEHMYIPYTPQKNLILLALRSSKYKIN